MPDQVRHDEIGDGDRQLRLPGGTGPSQLCFGCVPAKETSMNRNVTIGLGTLIVIIIIVALVF
jgi:hypothetical protein